MTHEPPDPPGSGAPGFYTPVGTRRTFFRWMIQLSAAVIGLGLAVPLAGYVISPALKRKSNPWVDVGRSEALQPGSPTQLEYVTTVQDGWRETRMRKGLWAVKRPGGAVTVFSPICPHLGCGVRWDPESARFKCPCHGSVFTIDGEVVAGPAPRSLDTLPSKVEEGRLFVKYEQYKVGLSRKAKA